jgi:hypothetical protein
LSVGSHIIISFEQAEIKPKKELNTVLLIYQKILIVLKTIILKLILVLVGLSNNDEKDKMRKE